MHVRDLNRSGKKSDVAQMEKVMIFQMKLPTNDKQKTTKYDLFTFEVHDVGIIVSPTGDVSKTKYRALIVSHEINSGAWSKQLHTLNAAGIQSANSVNLLHLPSKLLISLPIKLPVPSLEVYMMKKHSHPTYLVKKMRLALPFIVAKTKVKEEEEEEE